MSLGEGRLGMEPGPGGQSREEGALRVCLLGLGEAGAASVDFCARLLGRVSVPRGGWRGREAGVARGSAGRRYPFVRGGQGLGAPGDRQTLEGSPSLSRAPGHLGSGTNEAEFSRPEAVLASPPVEFCGCTGSADALGLSRGRVQARGCRERGPVRRG